MITLAKQFEKSIQKQLEQVKDTAVLRLYDVTMGYIGVNNPCDLIAYKYPKIFMLECKTVNNSYLNFKSDIRDNQWEKLINYSKIYGVEAGIIVWFYGDDLTYYLSIEDLKLLRDKGNKSFNCKKDIPTLILKGKKKIKFYEYDMNKFIEELINE